jgi:Fe2+ transport system protein FeoA
MDSPELNAEYNKLLAQKFAELGVTPGTAINTTGSGSSGTLQQDKSGGFNYIKGGAK